MKPFWLVAASSTALFLVTAAAHADGDAVKGEAVFKKCMMCHTIQPGAPNKTGPNLHGLFDREAGKAKGYSYSNGLATATFKWDDANLDKWLTKPQNFIAGAKMQFSLSKDHERADVIAYLHKAAEAIGTAAK